MNTHTLVHNSDSGTIVRLTENNKLVDLTFEEFYKRYHRRIYSICLRMTRNIADTEDLTHDSLIQVYRHLADFRGDSAFSSWLYKVTVNQVLMYFNKKSVRCEKTTESGEVPERVEPSNYETRSWPILDRIALVSAIDKLPPGYRSVFLLYDVEGYGHEEVAHLLGVSIGTSKSQLHRARMRLRAILCERI
jgi:RNA polymerase sigma-70 factor, ECF subfamily